MVDETEKPSKPTYYIQASLKKDLDWIKKMVLGGSDEDMVIVIDGRERSGKSVLALQIAAYLDPTFDLNSVCFTTPSFVKFIRTNEKRAVVFDESIVGLHSMRSMERQTVFLDELLAQSGQKNLITILVAPFFFELTRRTAIGRSQFLLHVFRDASFIRGSYKVYDYKAKRKLYFLGKRLFEYNVKGVYPNYHGQFYNTYPIDEVSYRAAKKDALNRFTKRFDEVMEVKTAVRWAYMARLLELDWLRSKKLLVRGALALRAVEGGIQGSTLTMEIDIAKKEVEDFNLQAIFSNNLRKTKHVLQIQAYKRGTSISVGDNHDEESNEAGGNVKND